jgi:hypothetical protein
MARPTNEERLTKKHQFFLADFNRIQGAMRPERLLCLMDRRFATIAGAQYEGPLLEMYENKPRFEFNRVALAVQRVENEYRNNRVTVDFQPRDGSENDELADACDGLYRADEQASGAQEAYDNAFREGMAGGVGAWRLRACLDEDEEEEQRQRVKFEPIFDADSCVWFDLDAKRADKRDATRCYVLVPWTYDAYIEEWNDDPASWPKEVHQNEFDWSTPDFVWVAEVYEVEEVKEPVQHWRNTLLPDEPERRVTKRDLEDQPELPQVLAATGYELSREAKRVERKVVHKYLMSGGKILEDCGLIAGSCIPIIPYVGRREVIDGIERCGGVVRLARDAQMLTNMLLSWLAEMASRFDIEKPILSAEQVGRWAQMWADDAVKKNPYLLLEPMIGPNGEKQPPNQIQYTKAPQIPPAMAALTEIATQALNDLLGNQQAGEQLQPNLSGKAVELIQNRLDMQVFIYMSNFATYAMKRSGEVWLSMMKDIARTESRQMKTISSDGQAGQVVLNQPKVDEKTGAQVLALDIGKASYDVVVDVGPSSGSQRAATVRALTGMASITDDPETKQALTLATLMNLEGEGLADLRDWARQKALRLGITQPTEEEKAELAAELENQQPTPQDQFLQAEAQKAQANTGLAVAKTEESRAKTAETLAGIETSQQQQAIEAVRTMAEIQRTDAGMG